MASGVALQQLRQQTMADKGNSPALLATQTTAPSPGATSLQQSTPPTNNSGPPKAFYYDTAADGYILNAPLHPSLAWSKVMYNDLYGRGNSTFGSNIPGQAGFGACGYVETDGTYGGMSVGVHANGPVSAAQAGGLYRNLFNFNPAEIDMSFSTNPAVANAADNAAAANQAPAFSGNGTVNFTLYYDRTMEMYYAGTFNSQYVTDKYSWFARIGVNNDILHLYSLLGMQVAGTTPYTDTYLTNGTPSANPVRIVLDAHGYFVWTGYCTNLSVSYTHFNTAMVPMRAVVGLTFTQLAGMSAATSATGTGTATTPAANTPSGGATAPGTAGAPAGPPSAGAVNGPFPVGAGSSGGGRFVQ